MDNKFDHKIIFNLHLNKRSLELTREGGGFLLLTFAVGMGAINTGNNLLYLILAMCCSFIAVSGILSEFSLKNLELQGNIPKTFFAEDSVPLTLKITNNKKKFPSFSILAEVVPEQFAKVNEVYYFSQIAPAASLERTHLFTVYKRGPLKFRHVIIKTSFPFGFFIKSKPIPLALEALVYPSIKEINLPSPNEIVNEGEGIIGSSGDDLYSIREFRHGDALSSIHWKSSARTGQFKVKEFTQGSQHSFSLLLNIYDSHQKMIDEDNLEPKVSETASLAYHLIKRGDEVRLKTHDIETGYGNTESHLDGILEYLAVVGLK